MLLLVYIVSSDIMAKPKLDISDLANPSTLDVKVGKIFKVFTPTLPLIAETNFTLQPQIELGDRLEQVGSSFDATGGEGAIKEGYKIRATRSGTTQIHVYYSKPKSKRVWVPQKKGYGRGLYGLHEQYITVNITD